MNQIVQRKDEEIYRLNQNMMKVVQEKENKIDQVMKEVQVQPESMIPASGSCRKEARESSEIAGRGSSIPTGNLLDFFPVNSSQFPAETGQKPSGNGRKISGGNTASGMDRDFAGSHRFLPYVFDPGKGVQRKIEEEN